MQVRNQIEDLIKADRLEETLQYWVQQGGVDNTLRSDLILQMSRLTTASTERNRGLIGFPEESRVRNEVRFALLSLLSKWNPGGNRSQLDLAIAALHIRPDNAISALHLHNCDRSKQSKSFRRAFNGRKGKAPFQFYFIAACPNEMPTSFSKRMIYEIVRDHLDERHDAISFPLQDDNEDRIRIEPLPLGSDLDSSIKQLKKYVAQRFRFNNTQTFDTFIETAVPKLHYRYISTVFDISDSKWDGDEGEISDYFNWMINTFHCPSTEVPTFIFFIVVKSRGLQGDEKLHTPRQKTIIAELKKLWQTYPERATLLADFPALDEQDFEEWVSDTHGLENPNLARAITRALAAGFEFGSPEDKLYRADQKFHMKDIEPLQAKIFKSANR
ncbi:MAG: hypothetical protein ACOYPR_23130 [Saprospiraceae bacterium]